MNYKTVKFIEWFEDYRHDFEAGRITVRGLARKAFNELAMWDNYDTARTFTRRQLGVLSTERKHFIETKPPIMTMSESVKVGLKWPDSEANTREPFILVPPNFVGVMKIGLISDVHIPFHHIGAIEAAIGYFLKHEIDTLILNGDIIDCYELSEHDKSLDRPDTVEELMRLRQFLAEVRSLFPKARIVYKLGNHEDRWRRRLLKNAPEIAKVLEMEMGGFYGFKQLTRLDDFGIELVSEPVAIKVHDLNILHGHELGSGGGVNPARWLYLNAGASTIVGHFHRISSHSESSINDNSVRTYSTGCMCDLSPDYRPFAFKKWRHGFAMIKVDGPLWTVWNKEIEGGEVLE